MVYKTKGVCSQLINVEVENNIVTSVEFVGGCNGNTQGVAALCGGHGRAEAILPSGRHCTAVPARLPALTSCPRHSNRPSESK